MRLRPRTYRDLAVPGAGRAAHGWIFEPRPEIADVRDLRPRQRWPRAPRRGGAEPANERAPPHSITSSAAASSVAGISRPRALAVLRLIANSNFVGCSIGMSDRAAPRRILTIWRPNMRPSRSRLGP